MRLAPAAAVATAHGKEIARRLVERAALAAAEGRTGRLRADFPAVDPVAVLSAWAGDATAWRAPNGDLRVGLGVAAEFVANDAGASALRDPLAALSDRFALVLDGGPPAPVGFDVGVAFDAGGFASEPWTQWPRVAARVPLIGVRADGETTTVEIAVDPTHFNRDAVERGLDALLATRPDSEVRPRRDAALDWEETDAAFEARVADAIDAIHAGAFEKVVPSRGVRVTLDDALRDSDVFDALQRDHFGCHIFAFRRTIAGRPVTFVGASPERLLRREGDRLESVALAGTVSTAAGEPPAEHLLTSTKDRTEQRFVIDHLERTLARWSERVDAAAVPHVRPLRDVAHLETSVEARLAPGAGTVLLLDALHPTPAVAGAPVAASVSWLRAHEPHDRGWYAGFVGWLDSAGDGEVAVAIRSGLLDGRTAWLRAGAGIVRGSDPAAERREIAAKLRPLLDALR